MESCGTPSRRKTTSMTMHLFYPWQSYRTIREKHFESKKIWGGTESIALDK